MVGWKAVRLIPGLCVVAFAWAFVQASDAQADPITTIGFALDGTCVAGACPADPMAVGGSTSLPVSYLDTLPDGDTYQVSGTITSANPNGANFSAGEPFSIQYVGDFVNGVLTDAPAIQADTLTADIYHAWQSKVTSVSALVGTRATLAGTASGSSAKETLNVAGVTTTFGPYSQTVPEQLKSYSAQVSNPVVEDNTYTSVFGAGSPAGAFISYHGAAAPASPPTIPTCAQLLTGAVASPTLSENSLTGQPTRIEAAFSPQFNGMHYSLAIAASACGVAGFDWVQTIFNMPKPNPYFLADSPGMTITAPTRDPAAGGLVYCDHPPSFDCTDSFPFYYSIHDTAVNKLSVAYHLNGATLTDSSSLSYADQPGDQDLPLILGPQDYMGFITELVGYDSKGNQVDLPVVDDFEWKSTFDGHSFGGISELQDDYDMNPLSGTGGITLLPVNANPVPEPSSLAMMVGVITVGVLKTRKSLRNTR